MEFTIVGFFETYGAAEAAVTDLEMAGIVGEQVEMISDTDEDTRTADTPGEPSTKFHEPSHSRIARIFGADKSPESQKVRDISGDQPDYIGDQEFYANHVKQGGAVLIVRPSGEESANRAAAILHAHGARTPGKRMAPRSTVRTNVALKDTEIRVEVAAVLRERQRQCP